MKELAITLQNICIGSFYLLWVFLRCFNWAFTYLIKNRKSIKKLMVEVWNDDLSVNTLEFKKTDINKLRFIENKTKFKNTLNEVRPKRETDAINR